MSAVSSPAVTRSRQGGWPALSLVLFTVAFGTNIPVPLLLVYRDRLGLTTATLTAIFAVYAAGLTPALFLAGSSSDRLGRRPVVLPFVALSAVASGLFVVAVHSVALLYVARFLQGVVSGVVFSVLSAWLQDVSDHSRPQVAARRATVAMTLGFSLGPLTSGLLAQWGPAPTTLPYLAHIVAVTTGLVAVFSVPETVTEPRPGRLVQLRLPTGSAPAFWLVVAPTAFCVYAFPAMSVSSLPLLVDLGSKRLAVLGVIGAVTLGAGTLVQPAGQRLREWSAPVGAACGAAGFALSLVALAANAWPVLLAVGVLLGAGSGLCQLAGLTLIARLAPPQTRGALNSAFYAAAYAGFATPVVVALVDRRVGVALPFTVLAGAFTCLAAWLAAHLDRPVVASR